MSDRFVELKDMIEGELARTGFNPPVNPPGPEPALPPRLTHIHLEGLINLCDDFQAFYNFLTDEITRGLTFEEITRARVAFTKAQARKRVLADKAFTNDKVRDAEVDADSDVLEAVCEYLYFRQMHEAQEERRRKISKSMDRLYRELNLRGQATPRFGTDQHSGRAPMPSSGFPDGFKPLSRAPYLPSGPDESTPLDK